MGSQFNIKDMPERSAQQLQDLHDWSGYTKTQAVLIAIERLWLTVKEERQSQMSKIRNDGNISFNIDGLVAKVVKTDEKKELFSSTDHGEAEEKYSEAIMLRDLSGFKDAESIKKHLQ